MVERVSKQRRRSFGKIEKRKSKKRGIFFHASYAIPEEFYSDFTQLVGQKRVYRDFDTKSEAEVWLAQVEREIKLGIWKPEQVEKQEEQMDSITFAQYAPNVIERRKKPNGEPIKETSKVKDREALKMYLIPYFGRMRMVDITVYDVQHWVDEGFQPLKKSTNRLDRLYHVYKTLRKIMKHAATTPIDRDGNTLISKDPCANVKVAKPDYDKKEKVRPTMEQLTQLIEGMRTPAFKVAIDLASTTGLREGEVLALRLCDLHLDEKPYISVRQNVQRITGVGLVLQSPKTKSSIRDVPIGAHERDLLQQWVQENHITNPEALLFTTKEGTPYDPAKLRDEERKVRKTIQGLEEMKVHHLRAHSLSTMGESGASVSEIMAMGGHTSMEVAAQYQVSQQEHMLEIIQKRDEDIARKKAEAHATATQQDNDSMHALIAQTLMQMNASERVAWFSRQVETDAQLCAGVWRALDSEERSRVLGALEEGARGMLVASL